MNRNLRHRYPCLWRRLPWRERIGAPAALAGFVAILAAAWVLT